jgi:hypothetical protein
MPSPSQPLTNGPGQPAYRPPSDLSGETWAGTLDGHEVTLTFGGTSYAGDVSVSDPVFGQGGRWHARGRLYVAIELAGPPADDHGDDGSGWRDDGRDGERSWKQGSAIRDLAQGTVILGASAARRLPYEQH